MKFNYNDQEKYSFKGVGPLRQSPRMAQTFTSPL